MGCQSEHCSALWLDRSVLREEALCDRFRFTLARGCLSAGGIRSSRKLGATAYVVFVRATPAIPRLRVHAEARYQKDRSYTHLKKESHTR